MTTLYWQDLSGQTVSVRLDVITSESYEDTVTISDHPVEEGVVITDHARDEPSAIYVEGTVSNVPMPGQSGVSTGSVPLSVDYGAARGTTSITLDVPTPPVPLNPAGAVRAGIGAIAKAISGKPKATVWGKWKKATVNLRASVLQHSGPRDRPKEVYDLLLSAVAQKALITVQASLREYTDMQITRLAPARSVEGGTKVVFQIDLRKIRIASSETVQAPVPIEARGATKVNAGAQAQTPIVASSPTEESKRESMLHKSGVEAGIF
jgi:hypothetical protein